MSSHRNKNYLIYLIIVVWTPEGGIQFKAEIIPFEGKYQLSIGNTYQQCLIA